jgi:hypothetical protein
MMVQLPDVNIDAVVSGIVTVFPDRMERYFSHKVFSELR